MARLLVGFVALVAAVLCWPAAARADVGVYPLMKVVPVGGVIVGWGDGSGLAVYLVPARLGPRRHRCHGNAICEPTSPHPPGRPFRFLGRLRRTTSLYARQSFSFPVPAGLSPGAYRMYLYCPRCGGSLIQSGQRLEGETIRLTARPRSRLIQVGSSYPLQVALAGGAAWVAGVENRFVAGALSRVELASGHSSVVLRSRRGPVFAVAASGGRVWALVGPTSHARVVQIDAHSGRRIGLVHGASEPAAVAADRSGIWIVDASGWLLHARQSDRRAGRVLRVPL